MISSTFFFSDFQKGGFILELKQIDHGESKNHGLDTLGSILTDHGPKISKTGMILSRKARCLSLGIKILRIASGRFGLYVLGNHEILTLKFKPIFRVFGNGSLRVDPRVSKPRFPDSP